MSQNRGDLSSTAGLGVPSLGAALRARRRSLDLTQEELADLAGVGLRLVHEVEHDKDTVQLVNLLRLLGALGLHLELTPGAADQVQTGRLP
jgi:HTH-type transcriptional regulator/antitoxin HipB